MEASKTAGIQKIIFRRKGSGARPSARVSVGGVGVESDIEVNYERRAFVGLQSTAVRRKIHLALNGRSFYPI
jgi:hypothetical protein